MKMIHQLSRDAGHSIRRFSVAGLRAVLLAVWLAALALGQTPVLFVSEIPARVAAGESVTIPANVIWELPATVVLPADKERQIIRGSGRSSLVAPMGQPAIQVYGRYQQVNDLEIFGNGAEGIKLGDDASTYTGSNFHGRGLLIRYCAVGLYNGKFDASSLSASLIQNCDVALHSSGNQDSFVLNGVTLNDSQLALWVNAQGKVVSTGGVFASNELAVQVGSVASGDSGSVVMNSPHFEWLALNFAAAPSGSPFVLAVVNSTVTLNNAYFSDPQGNYWPGAKGHAGCWITFNEGNPAKPIALGDCKILSSRTLTINQNGTDVAAPAH